MDNFIFLNRCIQSNWLWEDKPFDKGRAWIDMLMLANWKDTKTPYKGEIITCKRGDVNLSITALSERWGWGRYKTKSFLNLLEADGMITQNCTTHRTTITIENYNKYQVSPTTNDTTNQQPTNDKPTTNQQPTNITNKDKKDNKDNKDKEISPKGDIYSEVPNELKEPMKSYQEMRKKIKAPLTDRAFKMILTKVNELSKGDMELAVRLIDNATEHCWKSIYPLKANKNTDLNVWDC